MQIKIHSYSFDKLIEDSCTLIGVMDSDWTIKQVNDPWTDVLQFEETDLVDKNFEDFFYDPSDLDILKSGLKKHGILKGHNIHLISKNGNPCWIKCNIGFDHDKIIILALDVTQDIFTAQTLVNVSDVTHVAGWSYNPSTEKTFWSHELHKILEIPSETFLSRDTIKSFIHPSYLEKFNTVSDKLYREKQGYNITIKIISARQNEKWIQLITYPEIVNDKVTYVQGILKDITDIQSALIEVKELKETMEMALKGMKSGYFIHHLKTDEVSYSQSFRDIIGLEDHIKETVFRNLIHPDDKEIAYQRHLKSLKDDGNHYFNYYRLKTLKNTYRHYEVHGWRIRDEYGHVTKLIGNLIDVDRRIKSQSKAKSYYNQIKSMLDNGKMSSLLLDKDGKILMADSSSVKTIENEFGVNVMKQPTDFEDIVPRHEKEAFKLDFIKLKKGETISKELSHIDINGKFRWYEATYIPVKNDDGSIDGYVMNYFNITKRKHALNELTLTKNKLQEINRLKDNIINNMNHEIRTPLNGILGVSELLHEASSKEEQTELLDMQKQSGERLLQTLNGIINYSLLDAEKKSFNTSEVHLNTLVSDCFDRFVQFAKTNNVSYNLKNFSQSVFIISDSLMLQQCISNILHNAIKFSKGGQVDVLCLKANDVISIIVRDDGIGIEKENQQRVFEYFEQESNGLNRAYEGNGMGLSFSKKFIEAIGGNISLVSEKDKGSIFTLNIPFDK